MNYFVRTQDGSEFGPLTARQLRDAAKSGALSRGDLVRPDGTVDWFRAERVRGLEFPSDAEPTGRIERVRAPDAVAAPVVPPTEPPEPAERRSAADDGLLRHIEPLAARGFNVRKLDGEEVESVDTQGFLDVLRVSIPAALLGRRGLLVVTSRRVFVANATVSTRALQSAYLDRIDRIGFGGRLAVTRFVAGVVLFLSGLTVAVGPALLAFLMGGGWTPQAFGAAGLPLTVVGILLVLLARYRALEIGVASGTLVFAKLTLELDTLSRIDELREAALTSRSS